MYKVPPNVVKQIMSAYNSRPAMEGPSVSGGTQTTSTPSYWDNPITSMISGDGQGNETESPYTEEDIANATPISQQEISDLQAIPSAALSLGGLVSSLMGGGPVLGMGIGLGKEAYNAATGKQTWGEAAKNAGVTLGTAGLNQLIGPKGAELGYKVAGLPGAFVGNTIQSKGTKGLLGFLMSLFGGESSMPDNISQYGPFAGGYSFPNNEPSPYDWTSSLPNSEDNFSMFDNIPSVDIGPFAGGYGMPSSETPYDWTSSLPSNEDFNVSTTPGEAGGGESDGTVICTELHRQGLIDTDFYHAEAKYGYSLPIEIMEGYRAWAISFVRLMRKSDVLTRIVRFFAQPVLNEMAHRSDGRYPPSLIGSGALFMALPVCSAIGRLKSARNVKYAY